jgi:hypothetical protein
MGGKGVCVVCGEVGEVKGGERGLMNTIRHNLFSLLVHSCGTFRCSGMLAFRVSNADIIVCVCVGKGCHHAYLTCKSESLSLQSCIAVHVYVHTLPASLKVFRCKAVLLYMYMYIPYLQVWKSFAAKLYCCTCICTWSCATRQRFKLQQIRSNQIRVPFGKNPCFNFALPCNALSVCGITRHTETCLLIFFIHIFFIQTIFLFSFFLFFFFFSP